MDAHLFLGVLIYLAAAAIAAPIGRRLGVGTVLGYLVVGVLLGPAVLGWVAEDREEVMHFSEFGVVLMLFVIGLEVNLSRLWRMRGPILGLGGLQVAVTTLAIAGLALLFGLEWREALALGMILALSSTAIVMQTLRERGLLECTAGTQSFAVLLFQDIAVIPILAVIPLLAVAGGDTHGGSHGEKGGAIPWIENLPAWGQGIAVIVAVAAIILTGRYLLTPWLRWIARLGLREALTASALALVVGVALLMKSVGLSPALGTFVAGVVLASSEFRHELESDIEPFKALLLAVFFLAVGAGIDFGLVAAEPLVIGGIVLGLIALKFAVLYLLAKLFGLATDQRLLFATALAQGGEFAFVLGAYAVGHDVIDQTLADRMIAAVALSMALTPLLLRAVQSWILPRFGTRETETSERDPDVENEHSKVLLAGFGRFGHPIVRLLRSAGCMPTVLEADSDHVDFLRQIGLRCFYGDATRLPLLEAAGAAEAELFVIAIDHENQSMKIVETCQKHFPNLELMVRACSRDHAYRLEETGVCYFIEQLDSSLKCAVDVLEKLGHQREHAEDAAARFRAHEFEVIKEMAPHRNDRERYIGAAKQRVDDLESLLDNAPLPNGTNGKD